MSRTRRYAQHDPVAATLDLVGDRWTLLVVRELMTGPKRYTDLREGLPGIATDLLTSRLRTLERAGLLRRWELPPPAAAKVYELTDRAQREIEPVVDALGRAGLRLLGDPDPADDLHPGPLVLMLRYMFRSRLASRDETYALVVDGLPFGVVVAGGTVDVRQGAPAQAAMQLTLDSTTLLPVLKREVSAEVALDSGAMRLTGDPDALQRFLRAFPWPVRLREAAPVSAVV